MQTGRDEAFAEVLQQTVAAATPERVDSRQPEPPADEAPAAEEVAEPAVTEAEEAPADVPAEAGPTTTTAELAAAATAAGQADTTETIRRGEPERQETAGKGADSPRTSSRAMEPLFAAVVQHTSRPPVPVTPAANTQGVAAVGAARAAEAPTRGTGLPTLPGNAALRAPATQAAFRSTNVATAELFEQARDSVFKQILVKLSGDGGEMRLSLQPPELGELDLRLVVEDGNKLSLTIAAERQDMAQLLQRHLDELKHTLQQAGLEVTSTSVQTRSEFAREHGGSMFRGDDGQHAHGSGADADADDATSLPRRGGFISASSLDFWA